MGRFEQAKAVVKVLLEMLKNTHNNVAVIGSASSAWDIRGRDVSGNVNVLTFDDLDDARLQPLTSQYHQQLIHELDLLHPRGGSDHRLQLCLQQPTNSLHYITLQGMHI